MASEKSVFGSSSPVDPRNLRRWCAIPAAELPGHPELRVPYRQVADSAELDALMAMELIETIEENNRRDRPNSPGSCPAWPLGFLLLSMKEVGARSPGDACKRRWTLACSTRVSVSLLRTRSIRTLC
jgi:hypothetical protein